MTVMAATVAATGFGAQAGAQESSWADEYAISSLAEEAGIAREEAARRLENQGAQAELAQRLAERLKERFGGAFVNRATGDLTVNVLDDQGAAEVRAAGATPRLARFAQAELEEVTRLVDPDSAAARAGWVVSIGPDPEVNAVVVTIPEAAARDAARFIDHVKSFGERTRIDFKDEAVKPTAYQVYAGGQGFSAAVGCTNGFAARDANNYYRFMLTAYHCVAGNGYNAYMFGQFFGQRFYNGGPAYETATIRNWYPSTFSQLPRVWTWNGSYVTVKGQYTSLKNHYVCKSGMTTGWKCGYVFATGKVIWVQDLSSYVWNLTGASICSLPGDSGGPVVIKAGLYGHWWATGISSLGTTTCTSSKVVYYVPVATMLAQTGLSLVTG